MKVRNWKQEDVEFVKQNYDKYTVRELAKKLNKSESSITHLAKKFGYSKQKHKYWTTEEENYLRENYLSMTAEDMAKYLNRGAISVRAHLQDLNLIKEANWTKEEEEFLINNYQDMTQKSIANILNRSSDSIRAKCNDLNLVKLNMWSKEDEETLKKLYDKISYREIAKLINRTPDAVQIKARKLGLKKSPYYCNYRFFENIDTEHKAYWLGFMAADGWIYRHEETGGGMVGLEIQYGDIGHLKKFNKSIEGNYKIIDRWRPCTLSKNKNKLHHMCVLRIYSVDMYDDLITHGFTNDKSYTFKFPKTIPQHLIRHFMRGYFDGDGCFSITKSTPKCSYISSSKQIIYDFEKILYDVGITSTKIYTYQKEDCVQMWNIHINQGDDYNIIKFLNYLYKDATVYLDRKYEKYIKVLQKYNERLPHQSEMTGSFYLKI